MRSKRPLLVTLVALAVLVAGVAPAFAAGEENETLSIAVDQSDDAVTVSVSHNDTAVENASVSVTALNNSSYAGAGDYTTDENGTVGLPVPEENVTVEVTATKGNATGSATVDLLAAAEDEEPEFENFGQRVAWFVHSLLGDDQDGGIGEAVSEFVTNNNPSNDNRPDDAGPNADSGNSTEKPGNGNGNGHGEDHPGEGKGKDKGNGKDKN